MNPQYKELFMSQDRVPRGRAAVCAASAAGLEGWGRGRPIRSTLFALLVALTAHFAARPIAAQEAPAQPAPTGPTSPSPAGDAGAKRESSSQAPALAAQSLTIAQQSQEAEEKGDLKQAEQKAQESKEVAKKAVEQAAKSKDPAELNAAAGAALVADKRQQAAAEKLEGVCGGTERLWGPFYRPCFYAGAFLASASLTGIRRTELHKGQTAHTLLSAVIPAAGVRFPLDSRSRFSLDVGALSMLLSKDVTVAAKEHNACRNSDGDFERHLPCAGNVAISPIFGGYVGLTVGTEDIGLITFMPTLGVSTTSLDNGRYLYTGIAVGLLSLNKIINPLG